MKKLSLALFCAGFLSLTAQAADVTGVYQCTGHDPDLNKDYKVTTTITEKDDVYHILWKNDNGETFEGIGLLADNVLAMAAKQTSKPIEASGKGVQYYKVMDDGKLMGKWVFAKTEKIGTEDCEKSK